MFEDLAKVRHALLHEIPSRNFLVVGDLILDRYLSGSCDRISQEAPVPVVRLAKSSASLGGAANVARSLANLGAGVSLIGIVGEDNAGRDLLAGCAEAGIDGSGICAMNSRQTSVKTRVLAGDHQIVRIDDESSTPIPPDFEEQVLARLGEALVNRPVDGLILSDYAKGVCTRELCQRLIWSCANHGVPVYVDPKGLDFRKYAGATAVKPNRHEMRLVAQAEGWDPEDRIGVGKKLREILDLDFLALTLGPGGMVLFERGGEEWFPTAAREVFDVSGAGDAVLATVVCGLQGGLNLRESVVLGNLAAAQVVSRVGCVPVDRADLILAVQRQGKSSATAKLFELEDLAHVSKAWKRAGQRVAFTSGRFDLPQAHHIRALEAASQDSDRLIVALHVEADQSASPPAMSLGERIEILAALECVDAVVVLREARIDTALGLLEPDLAGVIDSEVQKVLEDVGFSGSFSC
jgi:D-beta-D-heptose 7-phosphate kinase/D-beta-D-heptose 1-phosphate adenosyltransferase